MRMFQTTGVCALLCATGTNSQLWRFRIGKAIEPTYPTSFIPAKQKISQEKDKMVKAELAFHEAVEYFRWESNVHKKVIK